VAAMLTAYRAAGGRDAALLVHSDTAGTALVDALGREAQLGRSSREASSRDTSARIQGLPARVLPLPVWHTASVGMDLWLSAVAMGASQVWVLLTDAEAPSYRQALAEQMAVANELLQGLGYTGEHIRLVDASAAHGPSRAGMGNVKQPTRAGLQALDSALRVPAALTVREPASFAVQADKRTTLELALDHLLQHSPLTAVPEVIDLPGSSPFGSLVVDTNACTMCLSCVGACPSRALADNAERPQLRFIEKNCVQCGLCATTCPENAITLQPRLWLADAGKARQQQRVLHEVRPFECVRCGKPFGTLKAIEGIVAKLAGHPAFQGAAADRLKMCGDCRVVDLHTNPNEVRITDL
jgi:ferredoxin